MPCMVSHTLKQDEDWCRIISRSYASFFFWHTPVPFCFTAAKPTNPGRTTCRWRHERLCCDISYRACGRSGRGPKKAIVPFAILTSCTSSSICQRRKNRPSLVIRQSRSEGEPMVKSVCFMVRIFQIANGAPLRPVLVWVKKAGWVGSDTLIRHHKSKSKGAVKMSNSTAVRRLNHSPSRIAVSP